MKAFIIAIVAILCTMMLFGLFQGSITANLIKEESLIISFPKSADFSNPDAAGVVFEFNFPASSFKVNNKTADILLFLDSDVISGLKVGYDVNEKKIKAGLPVIETGEINLLDGKSHKIWYSFHRAEKKQSIHLDDQLLVEGEFTGERVGSTITGFATYQKWTKVESPIRIKISQK